MDPAGAEEIKTKNGWNMNEGIDVFKRTIETRTQELPIREEIRDFVIGFREFGYGFQPIVPFTNSSVIPGIFWFAARYTFDGFIYELGYGDRELYVESKLYFPKHNMYSCYPTFLLQAIGKYRKPDSIFPKDFYEGIKARVEIELSQLVEFFDEFSNVSESSIDSVQKILRKELIYDTEQQRIKDQRKDSERAKLFFHDRKYEEFMAIIEKHKDSSDLDQSVKAMIEFCGKKGF